MEKRSTEIQGDPYLANAIANLRAAGAELAAANWAEDKTVDEIRAEIHRSLKEFRRGGDRQLYHRANTLIELLNLRARLARKEPA